MRFLLPLALIRMTATRVAAQEPPVVSPVPPASLAPSLPEAAPKLPQGAADVAPLSAATPSVDTPADLLAIVLRAHWVVKSVMAALAGMAFAVLTVLLSKTAEIGRVLRRLRQSFRSIAPDGALARLPTAP